MITYSMLHGLADEIDNRLGPIPGPRADVIARALRAAAERCAVGDTLAETAENFARCTVPSCDIRELLRLTIARWRKG